MSIAATQGSPEIPSQTLSKGYSVISRNSSLIPHISDGTGSSSVIVVDSFVAEKRRLAKAPKSESLNFIPTTFTTFGSASVIISIGSPEILRKLRSIPGEYAMMFTPPSSLSAKSSNPKVKLPVKTARKTFIVKITPKIANVNADLVRFFPTYRIETIPIARIFLICWKTSLNRFEIHSRFKAIKIIVPNTNANMPTRNVYNAIC